MKTIFIGLSLLVVVSARSQYVTDVFTATTNEVADGLNQTKPVTPWGLKQSGVLGQGGGNTKAITNSVLLTPAISGEIIPGSQALNPSTAPHSFTGTIFIGDGGTYTCYSGMANAIDNGYGGDPNEENFLVNDLSGQTFVMWSSTNATLPLVKWTFVNVLSEFPVGDGTSHYGITATVPASGMKYYIQKTSGLVVQGAISGADNGQTYSLDMDSGGNLNLNQNGLSRMTFASDHHVYFNDVNGSGFADINTSDGSASFATVSSYSSTTYGVFGNSSSTYGVYGYSSADAGVYGYSTVAQGVSGFSSATEGVYGYSTASVGVVGYSDASYGVYGESPVDVGVYGDSSYSYGVVGNSTSDAGVYGTSTASFGVSGNSTASYGVYGNSSAAQGVFGSSSAAQGVYGNSTSDAGVRGDSSADVGVYGYSETSDKYGVYGVSDGGHGVLSDGDLLVTTSASFANGDATIGSDGSASFAAVTGNSTSDAGVYGESSAYIGVVGYSTSDAGVYGHSTASYGVYGTSSADVGVFGNSTTADKYGVYGTSSGGHGVWSDGDLLVTTSASFANDNCGVDAANGRLFQKTPNGTKVYLHLTNPVAGVSTATWTTTP